jgi:tRNA(Ile)-lysidine synthase
MQRDFRRFVRERQLIPIDTAGIVSFSGGPDSLCLLSLLADVSSAWRLRLWAVHVDHALRAESRDEAARAMSLAGRLGLPASVVRLDGLARERGNLQQRARDARLRALREAADQHGAQWIALGHTADDQAETVLARVMRGAGTRGLGGMEARSGRFIRPILWARRGAIEAYLERHGLRSIQDPTNARDDYQRNRVRHQLIPRLARENPKVVECLNRVADTCREESEALEQLASKALERARIQGGLELEALRHEPAGLLHRILGQYYESVTGTRRGLERAHLTALAAMVAERDGSAGLDLPRVRARRAYDRLWLVRQTGTVAPTVRNEVVFVEGPGVWGLPQGGRLTVDERCSAGPALDELPLAAVEWPLEVRKTRPGDRIAIGQGKHRKVARALMDAKVPRDERQAMYVVTQRQRVLLIIGLRRAVGLAAPKGCRVIRFSIQK